jgi:hypothetical protein
LPFPSVGATENLMMAAVLARGTTEIRNAAVEPEIVDLALLLQAMGAIIVQETDRTWVIQGVDALRPADHRVVNDRIEAASFAASAVATRGEVFIRGADQLHLLTFLNWLRRAGGEYESWSKRSLEGQRFVYLWADGIYSNIRLDDERQCLLVVIGALEDGRKQLLAVHDGFRESELSWTEMLADLKARGLELPPKLAVDDGGLGFWAALRKVFPATKQQRCWVHKTANVLDKLPRSMQGKGKQALHDIYLAEGRQAAGEAFDRFVALYRVKFPKAVECLEKDREELLAFYDFPAEHWGHLRTTNPIESTFATVRLRQRRTKGCGSREASLTMAFMLVRQAERHWRRLNGSEVIVHVLEGKKFKDGVMVQERAA